MKFWNIGAGATTQAELTDVSTPHVAADIATDAIETAKVKDGEVTALKLATDSVETAKIKALNVTTAKIAAGNVTNAKLGTDIAIGGIQRIYCLFYSAIGQGTWTGSAPNSTHYGNYVWTNQSAHADGDNVSYKVYFPAGTYKVWLYANKDSIDGILKVEIAGSDVATFDLYAASSSINNQFSQGSIAITTTGLKTVKLKIDGKNASSGGHRVEMGGMVFFERTA